jgi:hypothetical protein
MEPAGAGSSWAITLGDLLGGEDRQVVIRYGFLSQPGQAGHRLRARLTWVGTDGQPATSDWQELSFVYADEAARRAEPVQREVQRVVGIQHADRALRAAVERSRAGDVDGARKVLKDVAHRIAGYAGDDTALLTAMADLERAEANLSQHGYAPQAMKRVYFDAQTRGRGQRDLRGPATS